MEITNTCRHNKYNRREFGASKASKINFKFGY
jgi:hypothetical protein